MRKKLAIGLGSVVMVCVIVIAGFYLPRLITDSIYKNVDDISDGEMPATIVAFQSGPDIVSTIGGSGEGLNCSLPRFTNIFFDQSKDVSGKRHLVLQRFRQACVFHDLCYRHGLATYGYNQNDCDRTLQNEAFRLCLYIRNGQQESSAARCQADSKLVLAGVSIGGYDAYRAWDRSTYFEFLSDPSRSNGFSVSRVVDHPFKSLNPTKYQDDADQVILTFENVRSNLKVTCATCARTPIVNDKGDADDVSAELKSVGVTRIPDTLLQRQDKRLSATIPVWLPPRRRHAAPHLIIDANGKNHLIWMSRNNPQDTVSCIVVTDAAHLLTNTLPSQDYCAQGARSSLAMVEVDLFATSPLPMEVPGARDRLFATAISAQKRADHTLSLCSRSATRQVDYDDSGNDDQAKCNAFTEPEVAKGAGLGAFQNFAIVRPGQQIYFVRDVEQKTVSYLRDLPQRWLGNTYSSEGVMLQVNMDPPSTAKGPLKSKVEKITRFNIDDRFDPIMPLSRKAGDLRFLSLESTKSELFVRVFDFGADWPSPQAVSLTSKSGPVRLDRSWGQRPVIVLETRDAKPKTKLVFSRAELAVDPKIPLAPSANSEEVSLQALVFERDAAAPLDAPFVKSAGVKCQVKYDFRIDPDFSCSRGFDPLRPMRSSPASQMQASQSLVGRFTGQDGYGIAFPDACLKNRPIILKPNGDAFAPAEKITKSGLFQRQVDCKGLDTDDDIKSPAIKTTSAATARADGG